MESAAKPSVNHRPLPLLPAWAAAPDADRRPYRGGRECARQLCPRVRQIWHAGARDLRLRHCDHAIADPDVPDPAWGLVRGAAPSAYPSFRPALASGLTRARRAVAAWPADGRDDLRGSRRFLRRDDGDGL